MSLLEMMDNIFHRNKDHNIVLIGMGNLGLALSKYSKFVQRNMNIVATFDIDPFKQKAEVRYSSLFNEQTKRDY